MKKIAFITGFTPTSDNYRGPSALHYHLFKHRSDDVELRIYTFNFNGVPEGEIGRVAEDLSCSIKVLKKGFVNIIRSRSYFDDFRVKFGLDPSYGISNYRLASGVKQEIGSFSPDLVWVYDESFSEIVRQFSSYKTFVCGCDCFPLFCNRMLRDVFCFSQPLLYREYLKKYQVAIYREQRMSQVVDREFVVGIADARYYELITGKTNVSFFPHPHYNVCEKEISFNKNKLNVLVAGARDFYMDSSSKEILGKIIESKDELRNHYKFTFLGKNWDSFVERFQQANFDVDYKQWVDVYSDEVVKHDIQIVPISVGVGTKGKVLDSLAHGLLTIGTSFALENIYVKHGHSCLECNSGVECVDFLKRILLDKPTYQQIAENGRRQVLFYHDGRKIIKKMLDDILGNIAYDAISEFNNVVNSLKPLV